MIKKAPSYITSDGKSFTSVKDAQVHELRSLFGENITQSQAEACETLVGNLSFVIDVLKTKERKPRESKAVKVKRKAKAILKDAVDGKVPA